MLNTRLRYIQCLNCSYKVTRLMLRQSDYTLTFTPSFLFLLTAFTQFFQLCLSSKDVVVCVTGLKEGRTKEKRGERRNGF